MVDNIRRQATCGCGKIKHGMYGTAEYKVWCGMLERCENPNANGFHNYGGRGIAVCERWHTFANFYNDMGDRPHGKSLDRIDNDGDYEPGNVRWADKRAQGRNRRTNRILTINEVSKCIVEWAESEHISSLLIWQRLTRGWSEEESVFGRSKAMAREERKRTKWITIDGDTKYLSEWVAESGTPKSTIRNRLNRGWSAKDAVFGKK
jgi:hypothetical protein